MSNVENFGKLYKIMQSVGLYLPLNCKYSYDKERLIVSRVDGSMQVEVLEPKKGIRWIKLQEQEIIVDTDEVFKQLLSLVNEYDVLLFINSDNSKSEALINSNGRDFIHFDKNQYSVKEIRKRLNKIFR